MISGIKHRLALAAVITVILGLQGCSPRQAAESAPAGPPAVVVVSIDGFHPDHIDRYDPPHLKALAARGVRARWLAPSAPTSTFPNHYTLVTGLYPAHHGIVANRFADPSDGARFLYTDSLHVRQARWWGGEPLWVTAEKAGVRSGAFFWVGSEAPIKGVRPTFWKRFDSSVPAAARVDSVVGWMTRSDSNRVRLAFLYFDAVDEASHAHGPVSPETGAAVLAIDSAIGRLVGGLREGGLGNVNIIVVSDHGQAPTDREHVVTLDDYMDTSLIQTVERGVFTTGRSRATTAELITALRRVPHLSVYHRDSVPERWHYRGSDRIEPVIVVLDEGWQFGTRAFFARRPPRAHGGEHGYDQDAPSMRALFVAAGPAFRRGYVAAPFQNIHVYDLVCAILGLTPAPNDGSLDSVRVLLR